LDFKDLNLKDLDFKIYDLVDSKMFPFKKHMLFKWKKIIIDKKVIIDKLAMTNWRW